MFSKYKKIEDLEDAYDTEKKKIDIEFQNLNEQRYQLRRENDQSYEAFLYLKSKMNYSDDSNTRMMNIIDQCDREINDYIHHKERKLENYKYEVRKEYLKQTEKIMEAE
ncbi:hypothetical protein H6M03_00165 [Staphylococcus epidermidis]|uniref:Cytosolic protein n=1 Tax=Staphylococcus epidermidis (strain ATCC 35984 / DSM 28319 / BCRC 17069 / CCUG 31568 / BM 3577 / RP62A) TaxID=176279 RepID=Q5HKA0_STAEQ|nr:MULTISPECIES: hypothetical protein [Staphylococcus]AAW53319.1 conserved hypothetical protein [Staphylococcus epidermidis RP62A]EHR86814.1 hypothetical protein SEVCU117_1831 [Staphylococcus epidermidis VCU117]EHR92280.1 hypothetical protein SEVCU126_0585 [Staphylococcus epidermidis VCU126]KAB2289842.1 hypothetical protein F9B67_04850 [Staphylococcus epidermidis]MBM0790110.1 hypothetical protein [Staphylococcus epidermidis]